jgi:hypothetical protein
MGVRVLVALSALSAMGLAPATEPKQCQPARDIVQTPSMAPNSTKYTAVEPPARFLKTMPAGYVKIRFGREAIDKYCGVPPCGLIFHGCVRDDIIVVPDPDAKNFMTILRHEIAHFNGWPWTHGD